jgi:hypothetical protein
LTINHKNQLPSARAPIIGFASTPSWAGAIADLTDAYPETQRVWRGVAMIDRRRIVVQDEVEAGEPVDAAWNVHTPAAVAVQGNRATLTLGDDRLEVRILSPEDVRFEVDEVKVESPQRPVEGVRRLTAVLPKHLTRLRLVVLFEEPPADDANLPPIRALNEWPIQKP